MTSGNLSGSVALVTGASRGIGAAAAGALARAGAHVILLARNISGLEKVDDAIRSAGGTATLMPFDLLKLDDINALGAAIYERFGRLDVFVGNAGLLGTLTPVHQADIKEWTRVMDVNVHANFRLIRTLDPMLRAAPAGRTVFISTSASVTDGRAYWGAYAASKAALETLARTYAAETVKTNLRINILDPGRVRTDMRAAAAPGEDPMTLPAPDDIAPRIVDLCLPSCTRHGEVIRL